MEIIVDNREQAVIPYMEDLSHTHHINYKLQTLTTGDYAICYKGYIMIIIERKTYPDLAASLRDGRKDNINKLISLREATKCQVAYLIEGDAFPKQDKVYARMPYKNLRAHLDHIAFRDNIHMIYTKDQSSTANRLFELARNYSTIKPSPFMQVEEMINKNTIVGGVNGNTDGSTDNEDKSNALGNTQELTKKQVSQISVQEQLLRCLPGVGSVVSTILAENNITLYSIYYQQHSAEEIARFKYTSGGSIGLAKAQKIHDCYKFLSESKSELAKKTKLDILETIPGVSKDTAKKILSVVELKDIMEHNIDINVLKNIQRTEKTKLGESVAGKILHNLLPCAEIVGDKPSTNTSTNTSENKESTVISTQSKQIDTPPVKKLPLKRGARGADKPIAINNEHFTIPE
jgi:ERCC4-type nuclease